jgi:prepilin-type N-terminal cleavage/methylation domain-containing protein
MKRTNVLRPRGFTLVELMVAATASLIVIGVTISSLITLQQMDQRLEDRLTQEVELQRSLHFIAADIQEGKSIQVGAPELTDYDALFHIVRPDDSTIGYYTAPKNGKQKHPWSGPNIIFRKDSLEAKAFALIDQISAQTPQNCTVKDKDEETLVSRKVGFSLIIHNKTEATICIRGHLLDSPEGIEASIQAVTRTGP